LPTDVSIRRDGVHDGAREHSIHDVRDDVRVTYLFYLCYCFLTAKVWKEFRNCVANGKKVAISATGLQKGLKGVRSLCSCSKPHQ
jgi:hypothetical protein